MNADELRDRALAAAPQSAERILFGAALFNALTAGEMVLVGGGAQVTHTGIGRITDIDLVGPLTDTDRARLQTMGFRREGRHWVLEGNDATIAVEIPADELAAVEEPDYVELGGVTVSVISVTDLMMDRLIQATDRTTVTYEEALELAIAASDRIDWEQIVDRSDKIARTEPMLNDLPGLSDRIRAKTGLSQSSGSQQPSG